MLTPPDIPDEAILSCLCRAWGLAATSLRFLPLGADQATAVYRAGGEDGGGAGGDAGPTWFLKVRLGQFRRESIALPRLLEDRGIGHVIAPLPTRDGALSVPLGPEPPLAAHTIVVYPWVTGQNGFAVALKEQQWMELGAFLRRLHEEPLPPDLREAVPREAWSPQAREQVREILGRSPELSSPDPATAELWALLECQRRQIGRMVDRAELLAGALRRDPTAEVMCHTDIHAGNVLLTNDGRLSIVDWDDVALAPKERDLMFVGGGIGGVWNRPEEETWFYRGYGQVRVDLAVLAYYRYERILQDVDAYCGMIFGREHSDEDRGNGVGRLAAAFLPGDVVEIAHRTYSRLHGE